MITKFDSLYAGHVDMDDIGYGGTAVNSRVFPNEHLVTTFSKARNLARLLDRCGYDTFWLAEHHFQREGYECIPNVLMLALDLAYQTERLKMGCGFNITPMWHPLRLAEDFAMADVLPGGRGLIGGGVAEGGAMRAVVEAYRDAYRRAGRETALGEGLCIGFHFQLAATHEEAVKAAAGYFEENLKMFGPLRLVRSLSEDQIDPVAAP